jgi:hypothetical protein
MREKERDIVERLTGTAMVLHKDTGAEIARRPYHLPVWQAFHISRTMQGGVERIPGLRDIQGHR